MTPNLVCGNIIRPGQPWTCTLEQGHDGECVCVGPFSYPVQNQTPPPPRTGAVLQFKKHPFQDGSLAELYYNGQFIATVFPAFDGPGVRIISKHQVEITHNPQTGI